jgi:hypothetical protein
MMQRPTARALTLSATLLLGCGADVGATSADAATDIRVRPQRETGATTTGGCLHCSLIAGLITGGGFGGMMPGNPCDADAGMGMGMGATTFCNEAVFTAFTGCMSERCGASCPSLPGARGDGGGAMGPMCGGGMTSSADASALDAPGVDCGACLRASCGAQLTACEGEQ